MIQTSFSHFVLGLWTFAECLRKKPVERVITTCTVPQLQWYCCTSQLLLFSPKGKSQKKQTKQISSLLARTSVLGKPKDGLCSSWLAGVHSEQLSWEDFHSWYLILLPIKSRKMLLLTVHNTRRDAYNTGLGTFSCYKVSRFKLVILSFAPGQQNLMPFTGRWLMKENPSGVLQLQEHKYFTTTLSSAFSKPTNPSRKLPRKPLWR